MIIKVKGSQPITATAFTAYTATTADAQEVTVTCLAGNVMAQSAWFYLFSANDETPYIVWFNRDSLGEAPNIPGATKIEVATTNSMNATAVAGVMDTAIAAKSDFGVTGTGDSRKITNAAAGAARMPIEGDIATGFTFVQDVQGLLGTTGLTNLYKIVGFFYVPQDYSEGNVIKQKYFNTQSVELIVPIQNIEWISEQH